MTILIGAALLWALGFYLLGKLRQQAPEKVPGALARARETFLFVLPRVAVGLTGAGFLAELLPEDQVGRFFGEDAGFLALLAATAAGIATPGGPFVAFAIGAAALRAGASEGALIAYLTAWCLLTFNRTLAYEAPLLGWVFARRRMLLSLPLPLILGGITMLI